MAALVSVTCPSCHYVIERITDPDASLPSTREAEQPCAKCVRDAKRAAPVKQA